MGLGPWFSGQDSGVKETDAELPECLLCRSKQGNKVASGGKVWSWGSDTPHYSVSYMRGAQASQYSGKDTTSEPRPVFLSRPRERTRFGWSCCKAEKRAT